MKREKSLKERLRDAGFPDPLDVTESIYRDCLSRADAADKVGNQKEAADFRKSAARTLKTLRQYGRNPA